MDPPHITRENPDEPEIRALLAASDAYVATLYPAESNHMMDAESLKAAQVIFLVARVDGEAVGCAALVRSTDDWAEIKRMFVSPEARGHGLGRLLLQRLETLAIEHGVALLRLETGVKQHEALTLYRSAGYIEIEPFGQYQPDPLSIFMEKRIVGSAGSVL